MAQGSEQDVPPADQVTPAEGVGKGDDANERTASYECWRILLNQRALPLPTLRPLLIGTDPRNSLQLSHGSVLPFHARLARRGSGFLLTPLQPGAVIQVNGEPVQEAELVGGEKILIGAIPLTIERGEVAAKVMAVGANQSPAQEFNALLRRELARTPWFLVSIAVHALLFLIVNQFITPEDDSKRGPVLSASFVEALEAMDANEEEEEEPEIEQMEESIELPESDLDHPIESTEESFEIAEAVEALGIGDLGELGVGIGAMSDGGFGGMGIELTGVGGGLKSRLQQFRAEGLDLVFLIDTTASMDPFLSAAKKTVDRIITDLSALIPNLRLGIVAYRDKGEAYVTRVMPISTDRYAILNFLETLEARGGGNVPEALFDAVEVALDDLDWRAGASRVLLVVADAPAHPEDMSKIRLRLKTATRSAKGATTVSTILTGGGTATAQAEKGLREVAEYGNGEFSRLENMSKVTTHLITTTLGSQYSAGLDGLLATRRVSPRAVLVAAKVKERNIAWLVKKLSIRPIEPSVVDGLVEIGSPAVAIRCLDLVESQRSHRFTREASLYILRRITKYQGDIDLGMPLAAQPDEVRRLKSALERAYQPTSDHDSRRRLRDR